MLLLLLKKKERTTATWEKQRSIVLFYIFLIDIGIDATTSILWIETDVTRVILGKRGDDYYRTPILVFDVRGKMTEGKSEEKEEEMMYGEPTYQISYVLLSLLPVLHLEFKNESFIRPSSESLSLQVKFSLDVIFFHFLSRFIHSLLESPFFSLSLYSFISSLLLLLPHLPFPFLDSSSILCLFWGLV